MRLNVKLWTLQFLEGFFGAVGDWAERMRQRCAICPDCGRNRYTGKPCKNLSLEDHPET